MLNPDSARQLKLNEILPMMSFRSSVFIMSDSVKSLSVDTQIDREVTIAIDTIITTKYAANGENKTMAMFSITEESVVCSVKMLWTVRIGPFMAHKR